MAKLMRNAYKAGSWQETLFDVLIGLVSGAGHFFSVLRTCFFDIICKWKNESCTATINTTNSSNETLKIVGVGFGRTGTYSLSLALEELGYTTLHTQHLYENQEIFKMWVTKVFKPSLDKGRAELGEPDFNILVKQGYQATMDFPTALYYKEILQAFPDCKFILTTRDDPNVWFRSWNSLAESITGPANVAGKYISGYSIYLRWLFAIINKNDEFLTSDSPMQEQQRNVAIESYERHNESVRNFIPSQQLLEYSVNQGWEPLCEFLEVTRDDCPTATRMPFPKTNSIRSVQIQSASSTVFPFVFALLIIFLFFFKTFRKMVTDSRVREWVTLKATLSQKNLQKALHGNNYSHRQSTSYKTT